MSNQIKLSTSGLPISQMKAIAKQIDAAHDTLQGVYARAILAVDFAGASEQLFASCEDDCAVILAELQQSSVQIKQLMSLVSSGTEKIEDADESFKGVLVETMWAKFQKGMKSSFDNSLIGRLFGVSAPLFALFSASSSSEKGNTLVTSSGDLSAVPLSTDEEERSKVKIGDGDEPSDIVNSTKDAVIDNRRKDQGREGKKEEHERYIYSSTKSGSVSILGTDFSYDKYTDYTGGSISTTDGDRFYSVDTAFGKEGTHIDFESTDGSGLSGDITMNGITAYGTGEFDLAKGNAYIKAGADYSMYSLTVESQGDMGGFSLTGEVGAGLHLDAGIHDGKITVDAGVALGLGVGFSIEFDYRAFWDATCDAFGF